ncbi:MAG: hypothetical protein ISP90_12565, partial [Nevskia sp.]|nr:hypothetical protein [Nevskia sp.]
LQAAQRAVDRLPIGKDAYFGVYQLVGQAQIQTYAGAPDAALKLIAQLLAMPAGEVMSVERLKRDPIWDPLRGDPRFVKLIADAETATKPAGQP